MLAMGLKPGDRCAQLTGLSRSAVGACVAELVDEGLASEEPPLPDRVHNPDYLRSPVPKDMYVPDVY